MTLKHLAATASPDEAAAILKEDGAVVIDQLISAEAMDHVANELKPFIDATRFGPDNFAGRRTKRTGGLIGRSLAYRDLVMNPTILATTKKVLAHAMSFQLHL